jgi:putative transposase
VLAGLLQPWAGLPVPFKGRILWVPERDRYASSGLQPRESGLKRHRTLHGRWKPVLDLALRYFGEVSQSLHQVYAHIVFSIKDREPTINGDVEPRLYSYLAGIVKDLDGSPVIINGVSDHVHLLIRTNKNVADSEFMRQLKGSSSKWMKVNGTVGFSWQGGYGWFGVASKDVTAARKYIEGQKEHHRKVGFQEEYRKFLHQYGVEFDERYVWG